MPRPREPTSGRPQLSPHGLPAAHPHQVAAAGAPRGATPTAGRRGRREARPNLMTPPHAPRLQRHHHAPPLGGQAAQGCHAGRLCCRLAPPPPPLFPSPPTPHPPSLMGRRPPGACHAWLVGGAHGPCRRRRWVCGAGRGARTGTPPPAATAGCRRAVLKPACVLTLSRPT